VGAAQAKLQQEPPTAAFVDTGGFGGNQGLVIQVVEQRGFYYLGHGQGPLNNRQGYIRVHDAAFGNGAHRQGIETAVAL
jgi:hypothetical protein